MAYNILHVLTLTVLSCCVLYSSGDDGDYMIGVGRYDITGPAAGVEMMGYASFTQISKGIHLRQWSKAFIIADQEAKSRVVFVNIDACMGTQVMKMQVINKLKNMYGDLYTNDNVVISATHTHSAPAGYFQYVMYEVMSKGFVNDSLNVIVDGIVKSIALAHKNLQHGKIYINQGDLLDASINRSPTAYLLNPSSERAKYNNDTDKTMTVLKLVNRTGHGIGMISWFAVHCTSMNNTNPLISSDNKGYASYLMESDQNPESLPGQGSFVAAFAQSNEGDVSPNTAGPRCIGGTDEGKPCDPITSTCAGKNHYCVAFGPGKNYDMFDSTRIIGKKQYEKAKELYDTAKVQIKGPVKFIHTFKDFTNFKFMVNNTMVHTCPPAMGNSFAAGTIDGPGMFGFDQGNQSDNTFWNTLFNVVGHILSNPSKEQRECHAPKKILLNTGEVSFPYQWQPNVVPLQILAVGQLAIIALPGEFTTMAGRLVRQEVQDALIKNGFTKDVIPVIAGLANTYSDYITTFHEYQQQRYEGGSTIYGPHTLEAYLAIFGELAAHLANGTKYKSSDKPPDLLSKQLEFDNVLKIKDAVPSGKKFGDVSVDARDAYSVMDTVSVKFWAGNPRNNLMTNKTFLTVERKENDWKIVQTDASWDTRFFWEYDHSESVCIIDSIFDGCTSQATINWTISDTTPLGTYRIQHFGFYKTGGKATPYNGMTREFQVK